MSTLGLTNTGELTADSLTVKLPNCTPPRSNSICANHKLSRVCSFATSQHPFSYKVGLYAYPVYHNLFGQAISLMNVPGKYAIAPDPARGHYTSRPACSWTYAHMTAVASIQRRLASASSL